MTSDIYILAAMRTPMAGFQGDFASLSATDLGAAAISGVCKQLNLAADQVDEVYMGNVVSAGLGQAPARQAALKAGIAESVPTTTVSKVCGSGMKAVMHAADALRLGQGEMMIAGGFESMTNAPYLMPKARSGARLGHAEMKDALFLDGLEDAETGGLMGTFAQSVADERNYTRERMDTYAIQSLARANAAIATGAFLDEITPVMVKTRQDERLVETDQQPGEANPEKIPKLRPAFKKDGTVTAANSSSISDGAAALVLATQAGLGKNKPLAVIKGYTSHAQKPAEFTLAPIGAVTKLLDQVGWQVNDVDLFEINEAFAVVALLAIDNLGLDEAKVNVNGGACALGHPLGASGARIVVTLIHALKARGLKRGVASLCIGGGEATAIAIELCE